MVDEQTDEFAPIIELARVPGPGRLALLEKANIAKAAKLRHADLKRYAAMEALLRGWAALAPWKEAVRKRFALGLKRAADEDEVNKAEERLAEADESGRPIIAVGKPVEIAKQVAAEVLPNLIYVGGEWLAYQGQVYASFEETGVRAAIQRFVASGVNAETGHPCQPNKRDIDFIVDALRNEAWRPAAEVSPPAWLNPLPGAPDAKRVIACRNGLFDVASGAMLDHTPDFFTRNGVDFDFDPDFYLTPSRWHDFLESIWPAAEGGEQSHRALQEVMGYLLTGDTEFQKIFMVVGPPRCGKGTIARVISAMIGRANVVSESVTKLGKDFGVESLVGKQLLVVPDLRLGKDSNVGGITEFLLNLSGEDDVSIGRKFKRDWHGRLNTRALLISNMGLILPDQSGALAARLFPLVMHHSFVGREDSTLTAKLLPELPAIMAWALQGLRRLEARKDEHGRKIGFVLTDDGAKMLSDVRRHGSSVQTFLAECCSVAPDLAVAKNELFDAFEGWAAESDIRSHLTRESFTKELKTASGYTIEPSKPRVDGKPVPHYSGVDLKPGFKGRTWEEPTY